MGSWPEKEATDLERECLVVVDLSGFSSVASDSGAMFRLLIVLWLEEGREGVSSALAALRKLAVESFRASVEVEGPAATLHLLLTLSLRLSMALCTKPPMPFVGELGLSRRLWALDMVRLRPSALSGLSGAAKRCESREGKGVPFSGIDIMLMGLTDDALVGEPMSTDMGRLRGGRERVLAREGMALLGEALCGLVDGDIVGDGMPRSLSASVCQQKSWLLWLGRLV